MDAHVAYWSLVEKWREIVAQPLTLEEKKTACMSLLQDHINRTAWSRRRGPNRPLKFYADMHVLFRLLSPGPGSHDEFGQLALMPAAWFVKSWLQEHGFR